MGDKDPMLVWEAFYIIVGSSAGALTGLQFVVMALVADSKAATSTREIDAFGTPTIVHFCAVLLVSSILSAPWPRLWEAALTVAACGAAGIVYGLIVLRRARSTLNYKPEMEDWIWHCVLPLVAYTTLFVSGLTLTSRHVPALFGVAIFALILLFVGIHNAWDTVTYITVGIRETPARQKPPLPYEVDT